MSDSYEGPNWSRSNAPTGFNAIDFVVRQILNGRAHCAIVQVTTVTNAGGVSPVGMITAQPLVDQLDGQGNRFPHATVFNIPYFRLQGGTDAIIMDPKVNDIGIIVIADRDTSTVKTTKGQSAPGSKRQASMADGLYIGGFLNGTPQQFIRFSPAGIGITSPTAISLNAPTVTINAASGLTINADTTIVGTVTDNGTNIGSTHVHPGVQSGGSDTGTPV